MNKIKLFIFSVFCVGALSLIYSCQKSTDAIFTVPSTYRFNSPNLAEKNVYFIDNFTKKGKLLSDSLGDYNRPNSTISDSLNALIINNFVISTLRSITFADSDTATLQFGRLDTTGGKIAVVLTQSKKTKYQFNGNKIVFDAFPKYDAEITNSFLEVNICQEFTYRSQRLASGGHQKKYYNTDCTSTDNDFIINRIIKENPAIIYDTISIERVNYIFSSY